MRIGILEDNVVILDMLTQAMQLAGHTVSTYTTGSSFLEALFHNIQRQPPYDILLADYLLPEGLTGEDIVKRIREVYSPEQLPVIVISGTIQRHLIDLHRRFPDVIVISKPVSLQFLMQMIKQASE